MIPGWSAFCDLTLALYPVVFFWNVRLDLRVKSGLCLLMGLGVMYVFQQQENLS